MNLGILFTIPVSVAPHLLAGADIAASAWKSIQTSLQWHMARTKHGLHLIG